MTTPEIYANYVKSLLESEEARKSNLEQRATGVLTTSSALATLLFTLVGFVTSAQNFVLPSQAQTFLIAAIALFTLAVALGLCANVPLLYRQATPTAEALADVWGYGESDAQLYIIATQLKVLNGARRSSTVKGLLLVVAGIVQLGALVVLAIGVLAILSGDPTPINR